MKIKCFLLAISLSGFLGCGVTNEGSSDSSFAIYFLKDSNLTASQIWDLPIDSLVLEDSPFLPQDSLLSYKWQTHEFTVTASIDSQLSSYAGYVGPVGGIPFVAAVAGERVYLGAIWFPHSSWSPMVPYIEPWINPHQIHKSWNPDDSTDKRNDPRIYIALKNAGVLVE